MGTFRAVAAASVTTALLACGGSGSGADADGGLGGDEVVRCSPSEAVVRSFDVGAPSKADVLFVVDDSGSMCQEHRALTQAFGGFIQGLTERLGVDADLRIAVTTTDILTEGRIKGAFRDEVARPVGALNCEDPETSRPFIPDVADCDALLVDPDNDRRLADGPILRFGGEGGISDPAELDMKFRCLAMVGTLGHGYEKGLEAMRISLSCDGPNGTMFEGCCVPDASAPGGERFDATCAGGEPAFLRPEVPLIVVIVSDEPDCSVGADNPAWSSDPLCRFGATDTDLDGVPDVFASSAFCPSGDAGACFSESCQGADGETCFTRRCVVELTNNSNCTWDKDRLTPVSDYAEFLLGVKGGRSDLVVVVPIVGNRNYLDANSTTPLSWARPTEPPAPQCDPDGASFDLGACCADGVCEMSPQPSCSSDFGHAFDGGRYLELADAFPKPAVGCPVGAPANGESCANICQADFADVLGAAVAPLGTALFSACLPATPDCRVGERPCTSVEAMSPENIDSSVRVEWTCLEGAEGCVPGPLGPADFQVVRSTTCATGFEVRLTDAYPAGTRLGVTVAPAPAATCL